MEAKHFAFENATKKFALESSDYPKYALQKKHEKRCNY